MYRDSEMDILVEAWRIVESTWQADKNANSGLCKTVDSAFHGRSGEPIDAGSIELSG